MGIKHKHSGMQKLIFNYVKTYKGHLSDYLFSYSFLDIFIQRRSHSNV